MNGFGAGILWVANGYYISECACDSNKGFFNSYFWAIFMMSQIFGNLIAALVLGFSDNQTTYYISMSVIALAGALFFLLLKKPRKKTILIRSAPETQTNISPTIDNTTRNDDEFDELSAQS